jgi:hypothetical protein
MTFGDFNTTTRKEPTLPSERDMQLGCVRATIVAVERQEHCIFSVYTCSIMCPACNAHAPCCHVCPVRFYNIFPNYLLKGMTFEKKIIEHKRCVLLFSTVLCQTSVTLQYCVNHLSLCNIASNVCHSATLRQTCHSAVLCQTSVTLQYCAKHLSLCSIVSNICHSAILCQTSVTLQHRVKHLSLCSVVSNICHSAVLCQTPATLQYCVKHLSLCSIVSNICHSTNNSASYYQTVHGSSCKVPVILVRFNENWMFSTYYKKYTNIKFH